MNRCEFLDEVLNDKDCPNNFREIYSRFNRYQDAAMDTLRELHRICEKRGIQYQLAFGSLLGAIRDNGQIPWDYDIDVLVAFEDKMKLINALKEELDSKYYFYCPEIDKKCRHVIMRLAPKGYRTEALHVDVFFYIGSPNDPIKRKTYSNRIKELSEKRFWRLVVPREEGAGNLRRRIVLSIRKIPKLFVNISRIEKEYNIECNRYSLQESSHYILADSFAEWYAFPKELLDNTVLIQTRDDIFRISKNYDALLSMMYKDYMKVPNLPDRIQEVLRNIGRLDFFSANFKK